MDELLSRLAGMSKPRFSWRRVLKNRGCAEVDGISIRDFRISLNENLSFLLRDLKGDTIRGLKEIRRIRVSTT